MPVNITQDELNILNLNGMSLKQAKDYTDYCRTLGMSDEEIRQKFDNVLDGLKNSTPEISADQIKKWQSMQPIGAFEYGQRNTYAEKQDTIKNNNMSVGFSPVPVAPSSILQNIPDAIKEISEPINKKGAELGKWFVYRQINKGMHDTTARQDKIGFWESAGHKFVTGQALPFLGGYIEGAQKEIITTVADKIKNGENLSADEIYAYETLLNKAAEERVRGYSIPGRIGESFLPSLVRFGGEMWATGGVLGSLGAGAKTVESANRMQKFVSGVKNSAKLGAAGVVLNPSEVYSAYQNRDFENRMRLTKDGEMYFEESLEKPAVTFMKSVGDVALAFACEGSGEAIGAALSAGGALTGKVSAYAFRPLTDYLSKNKNMRKLINEVIPNLFEKAKYADKFFDKTKFLANKVKFDGFIEEIGEEKLEDILSLTFGLKDEKPTLKNYAKTFFASPDEWAVLIGAVALQGGTLSASSYLLSRYLKKTGMPDEQIQEALKTLPPEEQRKFIQQLVENDLLQSTEEASPEVLEKQSEYEDKTYNKFLQGGLSETEASAYAKLFGQFFRKYGAKNQQKFDEWFNKFDVEWKPDGENIKGNVKIYQQSKEDYERNLLMVHATKSHRLDDILESGSFVAPSMAIVKKGENHFNFGDVIFVRNPKRIDYQNDNIHDRDIYSPRLPQADYMTKDGVFVSAYEYDSMERLWKRRPEEFKRLYGSESFDEYFDGAKKVINMGFTYSGERKTIPYNNQNILNYIKKESLKGGENGNYGLSSLLARLAEKQTSKQKLKKTAKDNLQTSSEELTKKWDNIKKEYDDIGDKLAEYYFDKYSFYEVQEEVFYAIAKNNKKILNEYFADYNAIPKELIKEVKDFIETAKKLPRSYFEAKPMQEVSLSQFSHVLAKKDVLTEEQKKKLNEYGIKTIEYDENKLSKTLENIDKENKIYFQKSNNILYRADGKPVQIKYYDNSNIKDVETFDIKSLNFSQFANVKDISKSTISNTVFKNRDKLSIKNKFSNITASLSKSNLKEIISSVYDKDKTSKYAREEKEIISNVKTIFENAIPILTHDEVKGKNASLYDKQIIQRYAIAVRIGNETFLTMITVKQRKDFAESNIDEFSIYKLTSQKKEMSDRSSMPNKIEQSRSQTPNISINDLVNFVNSQLEKYKTNLADKEITEGKRTLYQTAYKGSPSNHDTESLDYVGTGEGAQAHGYGLYYAESKDVGEKYRKILNSRDLQYDGKTVSLKQQYNMKNIANYGKEEWLKELNKQLEDSKNELKLLQDAATKNNDNNIITSIIPEQNKIISAIEEDIKISENIEPEKISKGQLYEVDIPENDLLLDEDKKLNEQPEKVRKVIYEYMKNRPDDYIMSAIEDYNHLPNYTGEWFYKEVAFNERRNGAKGNGHKEASLLLNKYGIKGITYDGQRDGRCYVIFDDKAVSILKKYYQESNEENEKLIAGYSYPDIMNKLQSFYDDLSQPDISEEQSEIIFGKIHILEDAILASEQPDNYKGQDQITNIMLNAYYVMNNQELPQEYYDNDVKSERTYEDLKKLHDEKKEQKEVEYYGYFTEGQNKNIITIMQTHNASTALHELGHLFLNGLNELAKTSEEARIQLEEVNKWLGFSDEYTVAQQEKFARSFEAYLYKGKAPNNKLRQVFENFKEWLLSVYQDIQQLVNQGADISDEVTEMFDKMFGNDEYYAEKQQANELLQKIKKIGKPKKPKQKTVTAPAPDKEHEETIKRHKEVCYQILSVGTGKSIKYLKSIFESTSNNKAIAKKRDAIEQSLDKVEDRINVAGGMMPEWKEFFHDTGVSYETDEVNGSAELVRQALDRIINRSFNTTNYEDYLSGRADYFAEAIDTAELQYKELIRAYKNENKNVALSAMFEWLDGLNEEIAKDFETRLIYDMNSIDREGYIDKFANAKRQILKKAMELENQINIDSDEKYKQTVTEIIKSLNFLSPKDKAKLTVNILDIGSTSMLMARIDSILDVAKTMEDVAFRNQLTQKIHQEIQTTKNVKKNGRTVGKYDYRSNKIFEKLREYDRLTSEQADEIIINESKMTTAEDNGLSFADKLLNKFLSYKAFGRKYSDTELLKSIYDDILKIKLAGKTAKNEQELSEKLDETKDVDELIGIVENKKEAKGITKLYINAFGNIESTLNAIFNKKIKEQYGSEILYAETKAQAFQYEQKKKFEEEVAKIYGLPQWNWDRYILQYLAEKHTYPELRRKYNEAGEIVKVRTINRTLTKMDIIQAYIWSKNDVLEKRLINQFGEDTLMAMFDEMSHQDVKLAELMMSTAQSFYPLVNKTFINKFGLDLPKVSCYFPSTPERGSEVDLFNDYSSKSLGNGFTKNRANSEIIPMNFHNPVQTLYSHIDGVAKFCFMSEVLDNANLRLKNLDLKRVIINKYGEDAYNTLAQAFANVTYKAEAPVFNGVNKILDNVIGNWIQANVAIKPIVGLKQLLSANNYAVDMPYRTWQTGFLKALANPKQTIDYMMKIPYLKARYGGNFSNEFLKAQIENSAFATSKKLKDLCTFFVKVGDIGAIIFGGKPYIDYLKNEKGMSEQDAIKQFILSTNRSQQSSAVSSLSNFQVNMTRNPMGKLFIAFKNSPQQYVRMCGDAIISATNGDITKKDMAKLLFQYGYLQPFLYTIATSGSLFRLLFTGDDDDLLSDALQSIFNLNANALPLVGDIYNFVINKVFGKKAIPQYTPLIGDIQVEIARMSKEDVSVAEWLGAIGYLGLHVGLGYNSKAIGSMLSGVGDIAEGDAAKGTMKVLGYTDKRAERITKY